MILTLLGYLADAVILGTYAILSRTGRARPFHLTNLLGAVPLVAIEVLAHAWPVIPLTATFGVLGGVGLWGHDRG